MAKNAGEIDHGGSDDDENAADEGLHDVPEGTTQVEVALLAAIQQPERDNFRDDAAGGGNQHGRRGQLDRMPEPHCTHDQDQDRHGGEKHAVQERADDLGAIMAEGAIKIGRPAGDAGRDKGENHSTHSRKRVKGVGDDGDRAGVDADAKLDEKVDAGEPRRNLQRALVACSRFRHGVGRMIDHESLPVLFHRLF